jgi:hypothetical protein
MGVELMSIPAMSDEPERLFSSAKLLISDLRNRLGDDIIEASECLKSWVIQRFNLWSNRVRHGPDGADAE